MKLTYTPLTHGSSGISTWIFCKLRDTKLGASKRSLWPDCTQTRKVLVTSVQFSSVPQSCLTLFDPMNRSTPGLRVHHELPEFTQTHVHCVGDAIQPSPPLSSPSPPAFNLSQYQGSFQMSQLFVSGGQSIGVSASTSVLPMNTQD